MKKILTVAVAALLAYGGWIFSKPYLQNHFLHGEMQGLADKAYIKTDREIIAELVAFAQERGMPLSQRDFKITRYDGRTSISVSYRQTVETPVFSKQYKFNVSVTS
jgi:hypothetical protein